MFNWALNFFIDSSGDFSAVAFVFALCDLITYTVFQIAFQGLMKVHFRVNFRKGKK